MTERLAPLAPLAPLAAPLPRAAEPFVAFPSHLRAHGFAVAPEQTAGFIEAIGVLGPNSMEDIRRAAAALLAPPPERRAEFDALFDAFFMGRVVAAPTGGAPDEEDELIIQDARDGASEPPEPEEISESGAEATELEALALRRFAAAEESRALRRFERLAPARLPTRRSYRRMAAKSGDAWNMRRILRDAAHRDGEVISLPKLRRKRRQRRIVLLIDVSGSMKNQTESTLRFAHALVRAAERIEVFTIGTRLTRITRALSLRHREQALAEASALVADWDGGTRIGDALQAFLAVPRFAGFARGALVLVLSDGLERGDPAAMVDGARKLARIAWGVDWLTPLAADAGFEPRTEALSAAAAHLSAIGDGSGIESLCAHVLNRARAA